MTDDGKGGSASHCIPHLSIKVDVALVVQRGQTRICAGRSLLALLSQNDYSFCLHQNTGVTAGAAASVGLIQREWKGRLRAEAGGIVT
jgi:hypothetical protein